MKDLKYFEILKGLKDLRQHNGSPQIKIRIFSNTTINQLADILEYGLRVENINPVVEVGNYDNIVQDAADSSPDEVIVIFFDLINLIDGFHYQVNIIDSAEIEKYKQKVKDELTLVFQSLKNHKKVLLNQFHSLPFEMSINEGPLTKMAKELNLWMDDRKPANFHIINSEKIIAVAGFDHSFDLRTFFSSKALYTVQFFKHYTEKIIPAFRAISGLVKKVLILDCDNTLWQGIIGEDGFDGIKISTPYKILQSLAVNLQNRGILICLCSKNNAEEVDQVLQSHPDMILKDDHLVFKKVNWNNKASNIRELSEQLNLGLSSFVYIDDSDFEINLIKEELPEVRVYKVPAKIQDYPDLLQEVHNQFFQFSISKEDLEKTHQYKAEALRKEAKSTYTSIEDYLRTLDLQLKIYINQHDQISRIAQMTQKTNQFNLTTRRYTEQDIQNLLENDQIMIFTFSTSDKFGDSGITGLAIIRITENIAEIETLLMSCRVLGRNIEWKFLDEVIFHIEADEISARYIPTARNSQVVDFYDKLGFKLFAREGEEKLYKIKKDQYKKHTDLDYIKTEIWKNE